MKFSKRITSQISNLGIDINSINSWLSSKLAFSNVYGMELVHLDQAKNEYRLYIYDDDTKLRGIAFGIQYLSGNVYLNVYTSTSGSWQSTAYIQMTNN